MKSQQFTKITLSLALRQLGLPYYGTVCRCQGLHLTDLLLRFYSADALNV